MEIVSRHRLVFASVLCVLVIGVSIAWYLGSPIFIRTTLVEPAPVAVTATGTPDVPAVLSSEAPSPVPTPSAAATAIPTAEPTPFPLTTITSGPFHGSDEFHFGRGTASIIETAPGRYHLRLEDFSVRNGPDLFVYLSPAADGYAKGALELGRLKATDGAFGYDLPDGTDPADFASAIIWCKQFTHLFATAPFEGG
jgi:hypothetical protein